jgi:hypothetical protein
MLGWAILALLCLRRARRAGGLAALAPLALGTALCCLHPNGAAAFLHPLRFMADPPAGRNLILEWRPVNFGENSAAPYLLILGFLLWAGLDGVSDRFPWGGLTLALTEFTMAAAAVLAMKLEGGARAARRWLLPAGLLALAGTCWVVLARLPSVSLDLERGYPRREAELIADRYPDARLFNDYDFGGYLIYKLYPRTRVFIDGRLEPYGQLFPGDYTTMVDERPGWQKLLDGYRIDAALLKPTDRLGEGLLRDPAWKLVAGDARAVLFARRSPHRP